MWRSGLGWVLLLGMVSGCKQIPRELVQLYRKDAPVPVYTSFPEIDPVSITPAALVPRATQARLNFRLLADRSQFNALEVSVIELVRKSALLQSELKLVSYARQLSASHRYRINPFVPFLTVRPENDLLNGMNVGPAATPPLAVRLDGPWVGNVRLRKEGKPTVFPIQVPASYFPETGVLFLFDFSLFSFAELIQFGPLVLTDLMVHELTHLWQSDVLRSETQRRMIEEKKRTDTGHDTMVVSDPVLAYQEGLAEAFEALYGISLERADRLAFDKKAAVEKVNFLVNRQAHIRNNSFVYNLYDYPNCMLKRGDPDAVASGNRGDYRDLRRLRVKFYADAEPIPPRIIRKHCRFDSPARLEAKEGFIASVFYEILSNAALSEDEGSPEVMTNGQELVRAGIQDTDRVLASGPEAERLRKWRQGFLLTFRELVIAMRDSQATTTEQLLRALFRSGRLSARAKSKLAFHFLRVSHGVFSNEVKRLQPWFVSQHTIRIHRDEISQYLAALRASGRFESVMERMGVVPSGPVVEFLTVTRGLTTADTGATKRSNVSRSYFVDLAEMFLDGNETERANRRKVLLAFVEDLEEGRYVKTAQQLKTALRPWVNPEKIQLMIDQAERSIGNASLSAAHTVTGSVFGE